MHSGRNHNYLFKLCLTLVIVDYFDRFRILLPLLFVSCHVDVLTLVTRKSETQREALAVDLFQMIIEH